MSLEGRPAKLQNGGWGCKVVAEEAPVHGEVVTIKTRDGTKSWDAVVDEVIWSGEDKYTEEYSHLCSLIDEKAPRSPATRRTTPRQDSTPPGAMRTCQRCGDGMEGAVLEGSYLTHRGRDCTERDDGGPCYRMLPG